MLNNSDSNIETFDDIPIENIWFLFLYASDLAQFKGMFRTEIEKSASIYDLLGKLLYSAVEHRLKNNLNQQFEPTSSVLSRVRGRIDHLKTAQGQLMQKGQIACRFENLTVDTTQNRLVKTALKILSARVHNSSIASQCYFWENRLASMGVGAMPVSAHELKQIHTSRNSQNDRLMIEIAKLVFTMQMPTRKLGNHAFQNIDISDHLIRRLFEKAIRNFYKLELSSDTSWNTYPTEKKLSWPIEEKSKRIDGIMPKMKADIILTNVPAQRRIIIDTKFASIFGTSQYRDKTLKSHYIYQLYSYLRSQEDRDETASKSAEGILLHPSIDENLDEYIKMQGHKIRFVTINLAQSWQHISNDLISIITEDQINNPDFSQSNPYR